MELRRLRTIIIRWSLDEHDGDNSSTTMMMDRLSRTTSEDYINQDYSAGHHHQRVHSPLADYHLTCATIKQSTAPSYTFLTFLFNNIYAKKTMMSYRSTSFAPAVVAIIILSLAGGQQLKLHYILHLIEVLLSPSSQLPIGLAHCTCSLHVSGLHPVL